MATIITDIKQLRKKSEVVYPGVDIEWIVADLFASLEAAEGGGLAAIQLGYPLKIFVMIQKAPYPPICVVNPHVNKTKGGLIAEETCLSLPGEHVEVPRAEQITLVCFNQYMKPVKLKLKGLQARIAQHEIDHLEGKLIIDYKGVIIE